jgi:putative ABC transport system ATP-binding protein
LTRYRADKVGFVFQQFHLVPYLTAVENVMLAQYFHSLTDEAEAARALERVGLGDRLTHLPAELSGGEQQRVAIARALINQPKLILADEPTGNLDEVNEQIVLGLLRELHAAGHTILMVTHSQAIGNGWPSGASNLNTDAWRPARIAPANFEQTPSSNRLAIQGPHAAPASIR